MRELKTFLLLNRNENDFQACLVNSRSPCIRTTESIKVALPDVFVPLSSVSVGTDWLATDRHRWIGSIKNVILTLPLFSRSWVSFGRLLSFTTQHFRLIAVFPLTVVVVLAFWSRKSLKMFFVDPKPASLYWSFQKVAEPLQPSLISLQKNNQLAAEGLK